MVNAICHTTLWHLDQLAKDRYLIHMCYGKFIRSSGWHTRKTLSHQNDITDISYFHISQWPFSACVQWFIPKYHSITYIIRTIFRWWNIYINISRQAFRLPWFYLVSVYVNKDCESDNTVHTLKIAQKWTHLNSSPPGQNGRHFADDIFRCIFVNGMFCILIKISLKFVH